MKKVWLLAIAMTVVSGSALGTSVISRHVIACGGLGGSGVTHMLHSTLGEPIVGTTRSAHYTINAGFWLGWQLNPVSVESPPNVEDPSASHLPIRFQLYASMPNPTNLGARITYDVPASGGRVAVRIYAADGSLVRILVDGTPGAGRHVAVWDGRNQRGRMAASGVYFLTMEAPGYREKRNVTVIR
jgi:hypothetical protein